MELTTAIDSPLTLEPSSVAQRPSLEDDLDGLTGACSRDAWDDLIVREEDRQRRHADAVAVVMVDLNGLRQINNARGHAAGNAYLQRAAGLLASAVEAHETVARIGGDEFAVLLRGTSAQDAGARVDRLRAVLRDGRVDASIGWAAHDVHGGFPSAIAAANTALRADKASQADR